MHVKTPLFNIVAGIAFGVLFVAVAAAQPDVTRPGAQVSASAMEDATARAGDQVLARKSSTAAHILIPELDARYNHTTTPAAMVAAAQMAVEIGITNTGLRPWPAGGDHPVRLGYHWYDANGNTVLWDGVRAAFAADVLSARSVTLDVNVRAPSTNGTYVLTWDLVQEGLGWFSGSGVAMKADRVVVGDGVTFYGKGVGHGIGLSQWGAQGWAEGAVGPRLNAEEIVAKYFPGADIVTRPSAPAFRVLISAPATGCVGQTIGDVARMSSEGGMRLVSSADPTVVYAEAVPGQSLRASRSGAGVVVTDQWSGRIVYAGGGSVSVVPTQWWDPISVVEKGLSYRGTLTLQTVDGRFRVVNNVSPDDYMRGSLPGEMLPFWEFEALRAQAITARTYAAWRQSTATDRVWDVRDDTSDQCYGGHSRETERTNAAVDATAGQFLFYDGQPIRAMYASAHGGISENPGCVFNAIRVGGTWSCADGWPYLIEVPDPAELAAYDTRGPNPEDALWSEYFSGAEIRAQIIEDYGVDIGRFVSLAFNPSPAGRPISVVVHGSNRSVDLNGEQFLRGTLGLRSTLVEMTPF